MEATLQHIREGLAAREPARVPMEGRVPAAVAVIVAPCEAGRPGLLLIKRTEHPYDPWSGQMALPGGRQEAGDGDLLATAVRETREETSVDLPRGSLLGELDDLSPITPHLPPILVRPYVFALPQQPAVEHPPEVALHLWVPLADFEAARVTETIRIRDLSIRASGFRFGPHLVWGMTAKILEPFLGIASADRV